MCDYFVAKAYMPSTTGSGYKSAFVQWQETPDEHKHPGDTNPPDGALACFEGGTEGYGHIEIVDHGLARTTDCGPDGSYVRGSVNTVPIMAPRDKWYAPGSPYQLRYLGWTDPYFFGKALATLTPKESHMYPKIVDVSAYQSLAEIKALPFKPDMGIIKVTEIYRDSNGAVRYYVNPLWKQQAAYFRSIGAEVGLYFFLRDKSVVPIATAVDFFFAQIGPQVVGDLYALDWEAAKIPTSDKDAALKRMAAKAPEHQNGLYCNVNFWTHIDTDSFCGDFLWLAWPSTPGVVPVKHPVTIHQFEVRYGMDQNAYLPGDRAHLHAWLRAKVKTVLPPAPDPNVDMLVHQAKIVGAKYPATTPRGAAARKTLDLWKGIA
ncbi:MAG: GH25 family lysozyme [Bacillota bacterium]